jgi:UDP-N-acetylglucosamine 2-epimerase (non-hydrolysing)
MRVVIVCGTRPEAIKLAPVVWALRARPSAFDVELVATGQHGELVRPVLELLGLTPDVDLAVMQPNQTLAALTARCLLAVSSELQKRCPELVVVQGDTTTAMTAALAAFYARIPIAHVEAGLRSGSLEEPFPEEYNRRTIDQLARHLFAPTPHAAAELEREGIPRQRIVVTGNTVVDALERMRPRLGAVLFGGSSLPEGVSEPFVLVTCHRRETFGLGLEAVCRAVAELARSHPDHHFVWPVHLNPNVREPVQRLVGGPLNVHLLEPLSYDRFLALLARARLVLTDSGGVQEEAPSFGVPVLVLRERLDRPESLSAGIVVQAGVSETRIVGEASRLLRDPDAHAALARAPNPFGDGRAAERIADVLEREPC